MSSLPHTHTAAAPPSRAAAPPHLLQREELYGEAQQVEGGDRRLHPVLGARRGGLRERGALVGDIHHVHLRLSHANLKNSKTW